ncbi:hypothetical protein GCM10027174_33050 [Salinifilum aidingensis]
MTNPYGPPSGPQPQQPRGQQPGWYGTPEMPPQQPGYGAPVPGQPVPYPGGQPGPGGYGMRKTNGLAVASMVVSLVSIVTLYGAVLIGLVGAILGHAARRQINNQPQFYEGQGMALTGIIIGWITCGGWLLTIGFIVLAFLGLGLGASGSAY